MATTKPTRKKSVKPAAKPKTVASKKKFSLSSFQKKIVIGISIVLLAGGLYVGYSLWQDVAPDAATCASKTFKVGSKNGCVKYVQQIINAAKVGMTANTNGSFTTTTKNAVTAFQQDKKLTVSGTVDAATWKELCAVAQTVAPDAYTYAGCGTTMVKYTKLGTVTNCGTMQGGTTDGTYMYFACAYSNGKTIKIVKYTLDGKKVAESKSFKRADLGHANDMTFNKNLNMLIVAAWDESGKGSTKIKDQVKIIDPSTFVVKGTKVLSDHTSVSNICYNDVTNQYVSNGRLYDNNFVYLKDIYDNSAVNKEIGIDKETSVTYKGKKTEILNQGITCDSSYIYIMRVVFRQSGYNMVTAYDWSGNNHGIYRVDLNDEGENISLVNGSVYMGINEGTMSSGGNSNNDYFVKLGIAPLQP